MDVKEIQAQLARFAAERDWNQFHSPKNLAMALAGEVGELAEIFQWMTEDQSSQISDPIQRKAVAEELADITIYVLRLADKLQIDIEDALASKIEANAKKYPVDLARGNATKYNRRPVDGD